MKKQFWKSKKFQFTVMGILLVIAKSYIKISPEDMDTIAQLISTYVIGQGIADTRKE